MRKSWLTAAASMLGLTLGLSPTASVQAAEIHVLAGGAIAALLKELAPPFESASGHKLVFRFRTTPELIKLATSGDPFDLGVVPRDVVQDTAARARFAPGPTTDIARVGLVVSVRADPVKHAFPTPRASELPFRKPAAAPTGGAEQ